MRKQFDLEYYLAHPETKVVTKDGCDVTILDTDYKGYNGETVIAKFKVKCGDYYVCMSYFSDGCLGESLDILGKDLFFVLPDPAKKKVPLTYEDLLERVKAGKTMWIVPDNNKYAKIILGFNDAYCSIVEGINHHPAGMRFRIEEMMEYHFADGDPCWKEVEEDIKDEDEIEDDEEYYEDEDDD